MSNFPWMLFFERETSFGEFLELDLEERVEWVEGKVVLMTPARREHAELVAFLLTSLRAYVEARELGQVYCEPFVMKTGEGMPGRSPDVFFVTSAHLDRIKEKHLEGPADLVVEVLSPDSRGRDRGDKFFEYEQGGVLEYWLLDPVRKEAEFYLLQEGRFRPVVVEGGVYRSREVAGLEVDVGWFWQRPFPTLLWLLAHWQLLPGAR